MSDDVRARLMKVLALAQNGVGGEKTNASTVLAKLLKRHGLAMADLDDAAREREMIWLRYADETEAAILGQVIRRVLFVRSPELWQHPNKSLRGRAKEIGVKVTMSQRAELVVSWDLYRKAWKVARQDLINAFCLRHDLYGPSPDEEAPTFTAEERANMRRQAEMALSLTPVDGPRRRLPSPHPPAGGRRE